MYKINISSKFSEVRIASNLLSGFCTENDISVDTQGHLELILVEALNNVVEHAYKDDSTGNILIELEKENNKTIIKITDSGAAAPGTVLIEGSELPNENTLPEGGWGLCLIQALADKIEYFRYPNHNTLVLTKKLAA